MKAVIGPNGAGKTTLVNMISGTLPADEGEMIFEGRAIGALLPYRRAHLGIGRTFQVMKPFVGLTALENVAVGALFGFGGWTRRLSDRSAVAESLAWVHELFPILHERRHQLAGNLSGGEQQMCALARGLMASPRLLMIDEMSLGLAPVIVDRLLAILDVVRRRLIAILLVEQAADFR